MDKVRTRQGGSFPIPANAAPRTTRAAVDRDWLSPMESENLAELVGEWSDWAEIAQALGHVVRGVLGSLVQQSANAQPETGLEVAGIRAGPARLSCHGVIPLALSDFANA